MPPLQAYNDRLVGTRIMFHALNRVAKEGAIDRARDICAGRVGYRSNDNGFHTDSVVLRGFVKLPRARLGAQLYVPCDKGQSQYVFPTHPGEPPHKKVYTKVRTRLMRLIT